MAFCRYNPWGGVNGGETYSTGHVAENGFLCLGGNHADQSLESSPYAIGFVIQRARYWCYRLLRVERVWPVPRL